MSIKCPIQFSHSALNDLHGIQSYYTEQMVPEVGHNFVASIIKHIESLAEHPLIGRIVPEFEMEHIREIIHPPFRIVYLYQNNEIQIIRIWRSERLLKLP